MAATVVSTSLRSITLAIVWLVALWPVMLIAVHAASPLAAVQMVQVAGSWLVRLAIGAGALAVLLGILWPPFLPGLRLRWSRMRERLRQDPAQLHSVLSGLQHLETAAA